MGRGNTFPNTMTKKVTHPAKYSASILECIAQEIESQVLMGVDYLPYRILDPMAGVGGIFKLHHLLPNYDLEIIGIELELEWVEASGQFGMICGDARQAKELLPAAWIPDAIIVSPPYSNRMADAYLPDKYTRMTYANALGRNLTEGSAAAMQWGEKYRATMKEIWQACYDVLPKGGMMYMNCKDHIRAGKTIAVTEYHVQTLCNIGFVQLGNWIEVSVPHMRRGQNQELRVDHENIVVLRKA